MESFLTGAHIHQNKHLVDSKPPKVPCKADTNSTSVFKSLLLSPHCRKEWKNTKLHLVVEEYLSLPGGKKQGITVNKAPGSGRSLSSTQSLCFLHSLEYRIGIQFYWPLWLVQEGNKMYATLLPASGTMFHTSPNHQARDHADLKAWCGEDTEKPHPPAQLWGWTALLLLACTGWETRTQPVHNVRKISN